MAAMSVNTVMDVDRCLNPVAYTLPFTLSSRTVMDETQVEAKKKIKKLPLQLSFLTRLLSQKPLHLEDSERLQQQLAEKKREHLAPREEPLML